MRECVQLKNNRGFTLIEMIIVIAIAGIVFSIGYTVINKSNSSMNENKITYEGQQSIKIINKYLTKDLEECKNIVINGVPSNNIGEYSISLESNDGSNPKYLVKTYKYKGKLGYQIIREVNGTNLGLVENLIISSDENIIPFQILKSGNIYEVRVCYEDNNKTKNYNFKVSSRYSEVILKEIYETPENPEVDKDMLGQNGFIRFKFNENTASTSIGSSKPTSDGTYTTYVEKKLNNINNIIKTTATISPNNNNGKCSTEINSNNNKSDAETQQKEDFGKMVVNQVNVVIEGDITYDLEIRMKGADGGGHWSTVHAKTITDPGKYKFSIPEGKDIIINGTITKNGNTTGQVILTFGTKKTN